MRILEKKWEGRGGRGRKKMKEAQRRGRRCLERLRLWAPQDSQVSETPDLWLNKDMLWHLFLLCRSTSGSCRAIGSFQQLLSGCEAQGEGTRCHCCPETAAGTASLWQHRLPVEEGQGLGSPLPLEWGSQVWSADWVLCQQRHSNQEVWQKWADQASRPAAHGQQPLWAAVLSSGRWCPRCLASPGANPVLFWGRFYPDGKMVWTENRRSTKPSQSESPTRRGHPEGAHQKPGRGACQAADKGAEVKPRPWGEVTGLLAW